MLTGNGNLRTSILNVTNERKINNEKQHLISKKNLSVKKKNRLERMEECDSKETIC